MHILPVSAALMCLLVDSFEPVDLNPSGMSEREIRGKCTRGSTGSDK
jgi:hypothetical protein